MTETVTATTMVIMVTMSNGTLENRRCEKEKYITCVQQQKGEKDAYDLYEQE
jgi:hypothetical protein